MKMNLTRGLTLFGLLGAALVSTGCAGVYAGLADRVGLGGGYGSMTAQQLAISNDRVLQTEGVDNTISGMSWNALVLEGKNQVWYYCTANDKRENIKCRKGREER